MTSTDVKKSHLVLLSVSQFGVAAFLIFAIFKQPYDYYIVLRWIVCIVSLFTVLIYIKLGSFYIWPWVYGIIGVMFNPLLPVRLSKSMWAPIDVIASVLYLIAIVISLRSIKTLENLREAE